MFSVDYFLELSKQYRECFSRCELLLSEDEHVRFRKLQLSPSVSTFDRTIFPRVNARLRELSEVLLCEQNRLYDLSQSMLNEISELSDKRLALLVRLRHVDLMTWEQISQVMNLDVRWLKRLQNRVFKV